jgi:hypothetical protein
MILSLFEFRENFVVHEFLDAFQAFTRADKKSPDTIRIYVYYSFLLLYIKIDFSNGFEMYECMLSMTFRDKSGK